MKIKNYRDIKVPFMLVLSLTILVLACIDKSLQQGNSDVITLNYKDTAKPVSAVEIAKGMTSSTELISSCNDCHADLNPDRRRQDLTDMHGKLFTFFESENENSWCLSCHKMNGRDSLNLANGKFLAFTESHQICNQCHPEKLMKWEVGVHGKKTMDWSGEKKYLLRVPMDYNHSPRFNEFTPEPAPIRQEEID
jgi:hypothetical protein